MVVTVLRALTVIQTARHGIILTNIQTLTHSHRYWHGIKALNYTSTVMNALGDAHTYSQS